MRAFMTWPWRHVVFAYQFVRALVMSSVKVARDVIAPHSRFVPGIVEFPVRCRTEFELTMIANCITLTPGTLTLSVRKSPPTLWVHTMYCDDLDAALQDLREYEGQILRAMRLDGKVEEIPGQEMP